MKSKNESSRRRFISNLSMATIGTICCGGREGDPSQGRVGPSEAIVLKNGTGLRWELERWTHGWTLGRFSLHGKPVESQISSGMLALRNVSSGQQRWLAASMGKQIDERTARFSGQAQVGGVTFTYQMDVSVHGDVPAAGFNTGWSVDKDLEGWEVCLAWHDRFANDWRCQLYPFAGNSEAANVSPMRYCGVPAALMYRPDLSMAVLFGIDASFDYLNPTTWTGKTTFHFKNRIAAPQFRIGGGKLSSKIKYSYPLQLLFSDAGDSVKAITSLMETWIKVSGYRVDDSLKVCTPDEALRIFLEGRRKTKMWIPGVGYELQQDQGFVYMSHQALSACLQYRLYELTGDALWRNRSFEQMDFILKAQNTDRKDPHFGVFHTTYNIRPRTFDSGDRGGNVGYKVDMNAETVRYMLLTWQRLKEREGIDRKDWYEAAVRAADWIVKQQNPDGGLPQLIFAKTGQKSNSVVSSRALVAMPVVARITGDDRYLKLAEEMEQFVRKNVEGRYWFTGAHPDLPPNDFEQDSIWGVVEYWLDKHDRTGQNECLDRAVGDAYLAFLWWCPKQLSWVRNPTQCAHSEQQNWNMYVVYDYASRKVQSLSRLAEKTGNPLFARLAERVIQLNFWTLVKDGPYMGAFLTGVADPWLEQKHGFNFTENAYMDAYNTDLMLQLVDMGLVRAKNP